MRYISLILILLVGLMILSEVFFLSTHGVVFSWLLLIPMTLLLFTSMQQEESNCCSNRDNRASQSN